MLESGILFATKETFWISGHPTLIHATGLLVRREPASEDGSTPEKLVLKAEDDESYETTVEGPGNPVHPTAYRYVADLMELGDFSEACLL